MTYGVGMMLDRGLVFMSDTRTNAGVDNVATFRKMFAWDVPGDRAIFLLTAGNLATTQSVVSILEERTKAYADRAPSLFQAPTMFQAVRFVAATLRDVISEHSGVGPEAESVFDATLILGGQIKGGPPRLFLIYPEGNFIEASAESPFFQIGETKYGRPILVRGYDRTMTFEQATKLLLVSFDSTIKANLSVGAPLDYLVYSTDSFSNGRQIRFEYNDPYFETISNSWGGALKAALHQLPDYSFDA